VVWGVASRAVNRPFFPKPSWIYDDSGGSRTHLGNDHTEFYWSAIFKLPGDYAGRGDEHPLPIIATPNEALAIPVHIHNCTDVPGSGSGSWPILHAQRIKMPIIPRRKVELCFCSRLNASTSKRETLLAIDLKHSALTVGPHHNSADTPRRRAAFERWLELNLDAFRSWPFLALHYVVGYTIALHKRAVRKHRPIDEGVDFTFVRSDEPETLLCVPPLDDA